MVIAVSKLFTLFGTKITVPVLRTCRSPGGRDWRIAKGYLKNLPGLPRFGFPNDALSTSPPMRGLLRPNASSLRGQSSRGGGNVYGGHLRVPTLVRGPALLSVAL